jgi:hypothetical protein
MAGPLPPDHPLAKATPKQIKNAPPGHGTPGQTVAVTLSGLAITADGKFKKSKYLNVLAGTVDDYSDMIFTPEEAQRINLSIHSLKNGSTAAIPVICTGPLCPWATRCVFQQINKAPIGRQCLVEVNLLKQWQLNYLEEYDVDLDNFTEMTLINELVEVEILLHRCYLSMSLDPNESMGVVDTPIGFDHQGNTILQPQISKRIELREQLLARKSKLIKMLVGDRQEKYKKEAALKQRESRDPSTTMAQLKEQMEHLHRELGKAVSNLPIPGKVLENTEEKNDLEGNIHEAKPLTPDDIEADD